MDIGVIFTCEHVTPSALILGNFRRRLPSTYVSENEHTLVHLTKLSLLSHDSNINICEYQNFVPVSL